MYISSTVSFSSHHLIKLLGTISEKCVTYLQNPPGDATDKYGNWKTLTREIGILSLTNSWHRLSARPDAHIVTMPPKAQSRKIRMVVNGGPISDCMPDHFQCV